FNNFANMNRPEDEIRKFSTTSDHHLALRCVELARDRKVHSVCFDSDNNLRKYVDGPTVYEYSASRQVGTKFLPSEVTVKKEGKVVLTGRIEVLSLDGKADPSLLVPPPGAIKRDGCLNPSLPTLKNKVAPSYPEQSRALHEQGTVVAYVLIAANGTVR